MIHGSKRTFNGARHSGEGKGPRSMSLPSPGLVIASIALLAALAGTSYAAIVLPANSVGSVHIRTASVTSADVRNGSLATIDLSASARRALTGRTGPRGGLARRGRKASLA